MKKTIKVTLVSAMLCIVAVGCQPEKVEPITVSVRESETYLMYYSIDGREYRADISSTSERSLFFDQMFALASQGRRVRISRHKMTSYYGYTKETVTFTTTDIAEAKQWAGNMINAGYTVEILHNPDTGVFTCIATK